MTGWTDFDSTRAAVELGTMTRANKNRIPLVVLDSATGVRTHGIESEENAWTRLHDDGRIARGGVSERGSTRHWHVTRSAKLRSRRVRG